MSRIISVGMAELKTVRAPDILMTAGLGSCIGVCIYDPILKAGGSVHVMLPKTNGRPGENPGKYADTGVELLISEILRLGAARSRLRAKIAGGAHMFAFPGKSSILKIGDRNAETVIEELKRLGIPLVASDVGGTIGRTIHFDVSTGALKVRTINQGEKVM